jgi:NADPH:quinone reductase-like Zn-dependent oxidoreductase
MKANRIHRFGPPEVIVSTRIGAMVDADEIVTSVGAVLPLAELRTAHEMMEGMRSRPRGKIVLKTG